MTKISKALQALLDEAQAEGVLGSEEAKLDFAVALEEQRRRAKITYADLAKKIGTSAAYVSKVFRGDSNVTIETMAKLADAAGGRVEIRIVDRCATIQPWKLPKHHLRLVHTRPSESTITNVSTSTCAPAFLSAA